MKTILKIKAVLLCPIMLTVCIACTRVNPSEHTLMLYKLDRMQGKYVLCMKSTSFKNNETSLVVIGDTFSFQTNAGLRWINMTNAHILQTRFNRLRNNEVAQTNKWVDVYSLNVPDHAKFVFTNSVYELNLTEAIPLTERH